MTQLLMYSNDNYTFAQCKSPCSCCTYFRSAFERLLGFCGTAAVQAQPIDGSSSVTSQLSVVQTLGCCVDVSLSGWPCGWRV